MASAIVALATSGLFVPSQGPAQASVSGCQGSISPQIVTSGSATDLSVQITNNDPAKAIRFIQIDTPAGYFTGINRVTVAGWSSAVDVNNYVTLTGGAITPGAVLSLTLNAQAFDGQSPPVFWYTHVSEDPSGAGSNLCDGDFNVQVAPYGDPPAITNVTLSNLGPRTITVSWDTNILATGKIDHRNATETGTQNNAALTGRHSFVLKNLRPNTAYYYVLSSDDGHGDISTTTENSFLTPVEPPAASPPTFTVTNPATVTIIRPFEVPIKAVPTEKVVPVITRTSAWTGPQKTAPGITGTATDNEAVARIEYSIDDGRNWQPVDRVVGIGTKRADFSFVPLNLIDADYVVKLAAIDTSGNRAVSAGTLLVIDRLPPQAGELVITFGTDVLAADTAGVTVLVVGGMYQLTTSSIGGATSVNIKAKRRGSTQVATISTLSQSADTGLWNGMLVLTDGGAYELWADSLDGAGNRTTRLIGATDVMLPGKVVDGQGKLIAGGTVTLYYLEPASKNWVVWDGAPYGQRNPQPIIRGSYSLMVPAGQYYMETSDTSRARTVTKRFSVRKPTSLTSRLIVGMRVPLGLGRLAFSWNAQAVTLSQAPAPSSSSALVGQRLPAFALSGTAGGTKRNFDLTGRPTIVSLVNLWSPSSTDQLAALARLQRNPDIGVTPVFVHGNAPSVRSYLGTAGYDLNGLADPDGVLTEALGVGPGPKHLLIDRTGSIKKVMVGVLSEQRIKQELGGL